MKNGGVKKGELEGELVQTIDSNIRNRNRSRKATQEWPGLSCAHCLEVCFRLFFFSSVLSSRLLPCGTIPKTSQASV